MNSFLKHMQGHEAIEFTGASLNLLRSPGVYVFLSGDLAIYVGSSAKMVGRALARNHHKRFDLAEATSLILVPCVSHDAAKALERVIIAELKPRYNQRNLHNVRPLAESLGITDKQARSYLALPTTPSIQ